MTTSTAKRNATPPKTGKKFQPGVSGNPGGMAQWQRDMKDLMREHTAAAVKLVADVAAGNIADTSVKDRLNAAQYIIDQTCGKAVQRISGDPDGAPVAITGLTVSFVQPTSPVSSEA